MDEGHLPKALSLACAFSKPVPYIDLSAWENRCDLHLSPVSADKVITISAPLFDEKSILGSNMEMCKYRHRLNIKMIKTVAFASSMINYDWFNYTYLYCLYSHYIRNEANCIAVLA